MLQGKCPNCFVMEKQLQSKIVELRDKEVVTIEMQQLCAKMEKQLVQQVREDIITNTMKGIVMHPGALLSYKACHHGNFEKHERSAYHGSWRCSWRFSSVLKSSLSKCFI